MTDGELARLEAEERAERAPTIARLTAQLRASEAARQRAEQLLRASSRELAAARAQRGSTPQPE